MCTYKLSMNQGEGLPDAIWKHHVYKSHQHIRETLQDISHRFSKLLQLFVLIVWDVVNDLVPTKRACGVILQPGTNTISMVSVVAHWQGPNLFPFAHLA